MSEPKPNIKEETSAKKTRSPPKKAKVEQTVPKKKKLKTDAEKAVEKAQHLRFGKAELTPDELSRLSKAQKREMYAAHAARSAVHHEVDQYEDENVGVQALSEGEKAAGNVRDISKSRYARKRKKKATMQGKKGTKTARSSAQNPTSAQDAGASGTGEGGSNWLSRWKQRQEIHKSYYVAARSGTAAQTAGGKAASNGASAARSGVEQAVEKGKTAVSTAVKGLMNAAKGNAHVLVIVGVFLLLILMVMSGFSSCGILFSGGTQVSGQTMYSAEDRDIRGAEQNYKKLEKELDKKIKRTSTDHPGYDEYQYHLDDIEHDPWQLTSFLTTLYDDYTLMKNKIIGVCPNCGANVVEREKGWFCESNPCRFVLWKDNAFFKRLGKRLDGRMADKLLRDGRVRLKDCKSAKGKTYNATVLLSTEPDGRSKFSLEFEGGC